MGETLVTIRTVNCTHCGFLHTCMTPIGYTHRCQHCGFWFEGEMEDRSDESWFENAWWA